MYRSSPFRSTLNTGINMFPFQVCTEASDATKNAKIRGPRAKTARGKKGTKARKGCVSGSANVPVCGYIYIYTHPSQEPLLLRYWKGVHYEATLQQGMLGFLPFLPGSMEWLIPEKKEEEPWIGVFAHQGHHQVDIYIYINICSQKWGSLYLKIQYSCWWLEFWALKCTKFVCIIWYVIEHQPLACTSH